MDMDPSEMTTMQKVRRKMLRLHLAKLYWPRFNLGGLRALDFVDRHKSHYNDWTNECHFNMMNQSHTPTFDNPGFKELGIVQNCPLQAIHESCSNYFVSCKFYLGDNFLGRSILDAIFCDPKFCIWI